MRKGVIFFVALVFVFLQTAGCKNKFFKNEQVSSREEALFVSRNPDTEKNIVFFSVSSAMREYTLLFKSEPTTPRVTDSSEWGAEEREVVHIIVNKEKDGLWLYLLNDKRPPEVVLKKKLE